MAQCKKILENGERCSNRAKPGTEYCEKHGRIQFRPVPKAPSIPPPPPETPPKPAEETPPPPEWTARPSALGDSPVFPGLRADEHNVLVAPEGRVWLGRDAPEGITGTPFDRLVRLLSALSQEIALPGHVRVHTAPEDAGLLLTLAPPDPEDAQLSRLYDVAADAAALSGGALYVGQGGAFIQYRDGDAPRGYDAQDVDPPSEDTLYLIDPHGTHPIFLPALEALPLRDLLLRIAPLPALGAGLPEVAFALIAPPLYRMLARYFHDHHLRYRLARFYDREGNAFMLFEIAPRPDAPTGALVPAFVLSYLESLPQATVLTEVWAEARRRVLVEWRTRYPCHPRHVVEAFPFDSLLLLTSGPDFHNLCISPTPTFFEGEDLTTAHSRRPPAIGTGSEEDLEEFSLEIPVQLVPASGPTPPTAALLLDAQEMGWVRRLLHRLPGEAFEGYTLAVGRTHAILIGEGMPVETIPFGIAMRRVQDAQLFIPLRSRFAPDLPWALLSEALDLQPDTYTFLAPEFRLDVSRAAFAPLSRALVAAPGRPRVDLDLRPAPELPPLRWTPPPRPEPRVEGLPKDEAERKGLLGRFLAAQAQPEPSAAEGTKAPGAPQVEPTDTERWLRERAEAYREAGDHLSAAICFALADEESEAGRSYQIGARGMKEEDE